MNISLINFIFLVSGEKKNMEEIGRSSYNFLKTLNTLRITIDVFVIII